MGEHSRIFTGMMPLRQYSNTMVELLALYIGPERHNTRHYRRTDDHDSNSRSVSSAKKH